MRRALALVALLAPGCAAPPGPAYHAGDTVEWTWPRSAWGRPPALLELEQGALRERLEVHSLGFSERLGVHFAPPREGPFTVRLIDEQGGEMRAWSLLAGPARAPRQDPDALWLAAHPELTSDAGPRLMAALARSFGRLRGPEPTREEADYFVAQSNRVIEMAAHLTPPWSPAERPAPADRARFEQLARGLAADAERLARRLPPDPKLIEDIERERCTRCHLEYRFVHAAARHPARRPAGVFARPAAGSAPGSYGLAAHGQELFALHCRACHENPTIAPLLETRPPDLSDPGFLWQRSDRQILGTILEGGEPQGLSRHMPAFATTLTELDARDLLAYLRTRVRAPIEGLAAYRELTWGPALPLPPGSPDELARVSVFRGRSAGGELRYLAVAPDGALLEQDAAGRQTRSSVTPPRPLLQQALTLARASPE